MRIQLGKILRENLVGNCCGKLLQENLVGKSSGNCSNVGNFWHVFGHF